MTDQRTGFHNLDGEAFLHRFCVSFDVVDLETPEEQGRLDLVADECDCMSDV